MLELSFDMQIWNALTFALKLELCISNLIKLI